MIAKKLLILVAFCTFTLLVSVSGRAADYAVVVSKSTLAKADWKKVVEVLVAKHHGHVIVYETKLEQALPKLKEQFPRYTCIVVTPDEASPELVRSVHKMTRRFDDDPYIDTLWAILTGYDADNALDIAKCVKPLVVRKVASGTEVALEMCEQGLWYDELVKHKKVEKIAGGSATQTSGPADTTKALAETLSQYKADLFVTSGHASSRNWQIGFRYRNGQFVSKAGQMYGVDVKGNRFRITSTNPKVYLPIGNCSMGRINGPDSMALAWMNGCGVKQMIGYIEPTWFGYGGWGCLDYFVEQPGRYTLVEAFHANHHALVHKLQSAAGTRDQRGLEFDRDVVALYGDPKWEARMADRPRAYEQRLTQKDGLFTLTITPNRGADSFKPINTNGSQRGWRPIVQFLPRRIKDVRLIAGEELSPTITDDFILIPNPRTCDPNRKYQVVFRATMMSDETAR